MPMRNPSKRIIPPIVSGIVLAINIVAATAFCCLTLLYAINLGVRSRLPNAFVFVLGLVLIITGSLIMHEFGHLLGCLAMRLRFIRLSLAGLCLERTRQSLCISVSHPSYGPAFHVLALPTDLQNLRCRYAFFVFAGPLANLVVAMVCLFFAEVFNEQIETHVPVGFPKWWGQGIAVFFPQTTVSGWLDMAGLLNILLFITQMSPGKGAGWQSDGEHLRLLFFGLPESEQRLLMLMLKNSLMSGIRPKNWEAATVDAMTTAPSRDALVNLYAYYRMMDCGLTERAGEFLQLAFQHRAGNPANIRAAIVVEMAFFEGLFHRNAVAARTYFEELGNAPIENQTRFRAEAAVLLAEQRFQEAAAKTTSGLAAVGSSRDPGGAIAERDWLDGILLEIGRSASASQSGVT